MTDTWTKKLKDGRTATYTVNEGVATETIDGAEPLTLGSWYPQTREGVERFCEAQRAHRGGA